MHRIRLLNRRLEDIFRTPSRLTVAFLAVLVATGTVPMGAALGAHDALEASQPIGQRSIGAAHATIPHVLEPSSWPSPTSSAPVQIPSSMSSSSVEDAERGCENREEHPPIRILQDEGPLGFTLGEDPETGEPRYRPGSGVVAGMGTAEDPFLIEGWCIQTLSGPVPSPWVTAAVTIEGTDAHVVVKDNLMVNPTPVGLVGGDEIGVSVGEAGNLTVADNRIFDHERGVMVRLGADGTVVQNNTVVDNAIGIDVYAEGVHAVDNTVLGTTNQGIGAWFVPEARFVGNTVEGSAADGIWLQQSDDSIVERNTLVENHNGISVSSSMDTVLKDNHIEASVMDGLTAWNVPGVHIDANEARDNGRLGIRAHATPGATISSNLATGNQQGIAVDQTSDVSLMANTARQNTEIGVHLWGVTGLLAEANLVWENVEGIVIASQSDDTTLQFNNIVDNAEYGLNATEAQQEVDARENWWGCADGPSHAACDAVQGNAIYDPWLPSPNEDAGAKIG